MRLVPSPPRASLLVVMLAAVATVAALGSTGCAVPSDDDGDGRGGGGGGGGGASEAAALGRTSSAVIKGTSSPASQDSVIMIQMGGGGFCSGTLIAPNLVLTARHCVTNIAEDDCGTTQSDLPVATMGIAVGGAATERTAPVAHAKKYFYNAGKDLCVAGDVALILLDKKITGKPIAKVRATPATTTEKYVAVGYGEDENKQVSIRRQRTNVDVVAIGPVTKTFSPTNAAPYTYELPAGEIATSEAVCHGDSGGPLFDAQGRVVGMTSRGTDPNDVCVARPDIFTAVEHHMALVDKALTEAGFPRTDADTGPSSADAETTGEDEDGDGATDGEEEAEEPVVKKKSAKSKLGAQANAGCSVARGPSWPHRREESGGGGERGLACVGLAAFALGMARARRTRRGRDQGQDQGQGQAERG